MALPNPNPNQQPQQFGASYQPFSAREAISTRAQAAFLQAQSAIFSRTLLRFVPGSSVLGERAELKKREMYESKGRDPNTGRKLTKDEIAEKEARKYDRGALGEIRDLYVDEYGETGVPVIFKGDGDTLFLFERMDANILMIKDILTNAFPTLQTSSFGSNASLNDIQASDDALRAEEMAAEQEAEDDQDQVESEQRQQGFFTKLFKGGLFGSRDRDEGGGLLSGLMNLLSPLLTGGIGSFIGSIITPILGALGTALTSVVGFIMPLIAALAPALPVIIAAMIAGGAAMMIYKWITKQGEETAQASLNQTLNVGKMGYEKRTAKTATGEKLYEVSDKEGNTKFATSEELNLNEEQKKQLEAGDFVTTDAGQIRESTYRVETKEGKETGKLAEAMGENELIAAGISTGQVTKEEANAMSRGQKELAAIERRMQEYSSSFSKKIITAKDNSAQTLLLVDDFNRIVKDLASGQNKYPDVFTSEKMTELTQKRYQLFRGTLQRGKINPDAKATIDKDAMFGAGFFGYGDEMDADKLILPGHEAFDVGSKSDARLKGGDPLGYHTEKSLETSRKLTGTDVEAPDRTIPISASPRSSVPASSGQGVTKTPSDIPSDAAANAALKSAPPVVAPTNNTVANVSNNNSATIVGPVSASRGTGVDMDSGYNGSGFRLSLT